MQLYEGDCKIEQLALLENIENAVMCEQEQGSVSRETWLRIVKRVVAILDEGCIKYHIDASSSLYVQGVDFVMDDLDVTVEWDSIHKVAELFKEWKPTEICTEYPPSTRLRMGDNIVHVMSYESESGIGDAKDRVKVDLCGVTVWCKTVEFYQRHMGPDHELHGPLDRYRKRSKV